MTDKEKLQQLFNAALQDGSSLNKPPTRAFPESKIGKVTAVPVVAPASPEATAAEPPAATDAATPEAVEQAEPIPNAGLDEESSAELGKLLDAQLDRVARRRRNEFLVTLLAVVGLAGGGFGWFVSSPTRVSSAQSAMSEIRSVGDIKGILAKYKMAEDKIAMRGGQIDDAAQSMGVDPTTVQDDDPYMEAETEAFTGEKETGIGSRNQKFQERFGDVVKSPLKASTDTVPVAPVVNR